MDGTIMGRTSKMEGNVIGRTSKMDSTIIGRTSILDGSPVKNLRSSRCDPVTMKKSRPSAGDDLSMSSFASLMVKKKSTKPKLKKATTLDGGTMEVGASPSLVNTSKQPSFGESATQKLQSLA